MASRRRRSLRVVIGREISRFGRRIAGAAGEAAEHASDERSLHRALHHVYDLPDVVVDADRQPTINVLVPSFDFQSMSAGFFGVFQVARFLRTTGRNVRLVLFDEFAFDAEACRKRFVDIPGLERLFDEMEVEYIGDRRRPLRVSPADACVATVWYSAHFARKIGDALGGRRFLYLIQDYETNFYAGNSLHALAEETYAMDYVALFSTEPLRRLFVDNDVGGFASRGLTGISFNNACAATLHDREVFLARNTAKPKRKLVFYSRPTVDRNMFHLAALALITAYRRGIFDPSGWDCIGMGLGSATLELAPGVTSTSLPRMTLKDYTATVAEFDVCLSLMASPHPSLVPMDCAGSGSLVVTNTFKTKTADYLRGISENIIPAAPRLDSIVAGLAEAVRRCGDLEARHQRAAEMNYPRAWEDSLTVWHRRFIARELLGPAAERAIHQRPRSAAA